MKHILIFFFLTLTVDCNSFIAKANDTIKIKENEIVIKNLFNDLKKNLNDEDKKYLNQKICNTFKNLLTLNYSFFYPFDSLNNVGKIYSQDSTLRLYTWNLLLKGGNHEYFGYIQYRSKTDSIKLFELQCCNKNSINENTIKIDNWYGALYYEIIDVVSSDNNKYYVLLGFNFNNILTKRKIIDALYFDNKGEPHLGLPVFFYNKKWNYRIIFEYSAKVSMILKYEPRIKMIVYDHLSPSHPMYIGKFQFYGPDFSYDALKLENGKWIEVKDIDIRNP